MEIKAKEVLIIDSETDFGLLMKFYLEKKGKIVYCPNTLLKIIGLIEDKRPQLIMLNRNFSPRIQEIVEQIVGSISNYDPEFFIIE